MNQGFFVGRVGGDAELRYTGSGKAVAKFSLAIDNGKNSEGGSRPATWVKCVLWEKRAESLAKYVTKGKCVAVSGPISVESWIDKSSGESRASIVVTVREFTFGGGGERREQQEENMPAERANTAPEVSDEDIPF